MYMHVCKKFVVCVRACVCVWPHLDFNHMDGVPATLDSLRVSSLFDENYSSKTVVQVPQVHRTHTTLKVSGRGLEERGGGRVRERERERESNVTTLSQHIQMQ